ncbi:MAG TPA: hypothetical protein VHS06_00705 [Chloroflexota bacterium]|nr:hypothetical protein [Chloroflexota bacterium]
MTAQIKCARCKEPIQGEPVVKAGKIYCSEACAFEAIKRPRPSTCGRDIPMVSDQPKV